MKTRKLFNLLSIITMAAAGAFAIGAGMTHKKAESVSAYDSRLHIVGNGTFGNWNTTGAVQLVSDGNTNIGKKLNQTISAKSEFKIAYIDGGSIQWGWDSYGSGAMDNKSYTFATDVSGNIKIKYDGSYDIYLTNNYKVYLSRNLTITFNANGGTVVTSSKTVSQSYSGASVNTYGDLPTPTRANYAFDGWYTESSGGTKVTSSTSTYSLTANKILYAHWAIKPLVTKYAVVNGTKESSAMGSEYVDSGTTYAVPAKVYREGYTFGGWYTNESCTTAYTARSVTSNLTLYAKYTTAATTSGTIYVDLLDSGWADAAANYAIKFYDTSTYPSTVLGWSSYIMGTAAGKRLVSIDYSITIVPNKVEVMRYNSSNSKASWDSNKDTGLWSYTGQISISSIPSVIRIGDNNSAYLGFPKVSRWSPSASDIYLDTVKLNGSNNAEYYSTTVTFAANQEFKVQRAPYAAGDYYGTYSTHSSLTSAFSGGGSNNIICKTAGTYAIYFDSFAGTIYITTVDIAAADEWAQYFLANVGCDPNGVNLPSGWSACGTEYAKLSNAAKDIVYGATAKVDGTYVEEAVARYDKAVANHPSLTRFIVNSSSTPRAAATTARALITITQNTNNIMVIVIISVVSVGAIGGYFLLRKRKENN